jgi:L-malate glycosyltransferase
MTMSSENKIKLLILADPNSPHTIKWVSSLAEKNFEIYLFSLAKYDKKIYKGFENIRVYSSGIDNTITSLPDGSTPKLVYLKSLTDLKRIINNFQPDILHAHYATSYGLLGALSGFHPYFISVWGSDVYSFPAKSFLHKLILKFNLKKADKIFSTSNVMGEELKKYTSKDISVIPFGIDLNKFFPAKVESPFDKKDIVIGTIKALEDIYGIEYLIRAFKWIKNKRPSLPIKLLIVGKGTKENVYKNLVKQLNIEQDTVFTGYVNPEDVNQYQNMINIFVALSLQESFGVSVLEAGACEKPVVVTNIAGFKEIVESEKTGLFVPTCNVQETARAIEKLILDPGLGVSMGKNGRERVKTYYNWNATVISMINIYNETKIFRL